MITNTYPESSMTCRIDCTKPRTRRTRVTCTAHTTCMGLQRLRRFTNKGLYISGPALLCAFSNKCRAVTNFICFADLWAFCIRALASGGSRPADDLPAWATIGNFVWVLPLCCLLTCRKCWLKFQSLKFCYSWWAGTQANWQRQTLSWKFKRALCYIRQ